MSLKPIYILSFLALIFHQNFSSAQCDQQVTLVNGTEKIEGTTITVKTDGHAFTLDYCPDITAPYFIGHSVEQSTSKTGSYTFTFDPPISMAQLNFSGISNVSGSTEEISIWVNGQHYQIKKAGEKNNCDGMGIVTENGNVGVPEGTSVGGWLGTIINGPITRLEVKDTVLVGTPAGALFSLFICPGASPILGPDTLMCKGDELLLDVTTKKASYKWQDKSMSPIFRVTESGTYWVEILTKKESYTDSIHVEFVDCGVPRFIPRAEDWKHSRP